MIPVTRTRDACRMSADAPEYQLDLEGSLGEGAFPLIDSLKIRREVVGRRKIVA